MIGSKITLTAATATKISTGTTVNRSVTIKTALTDLVLGGPSVTSSTGYATAAALTNVAFSCGRDDLWAISATGGDVYVLSPENG